MRLKMVPGRTRISSISAFRLHAALALLEARKMKFLDFAVASLQWRHADRANFQDLHIHAEIARHAQRRADEVVS